MASTEFINFSTASWFLREIKIGKIQRKPKGSGYIWSSEDAQLDSQQLSFLKEYCGINSKWVDVDTGLTWLLKNTHYTRSYIRTYCPKEDIYFAGHNDWRVPTIDELKTLRGIAKDECGAFVKPALTGRLQGSYSCCTPVQRGHRDDGMVWDFTSNQFNEVEHRDGGIKWGAEGEYAGFEPDRTWGEGASIYVSGCRTDKLSYWAEALVRWADEHEYHNFPVTTDTILALETLVIKDDNFPKYLSKLENLRKVDLYKFKVVPSDVFTLKKLEELNWNNEGRVSDEIYSLPDEIRNFTCLTSLIINCVKINSIPSSIGKLKNLKKLSIMGTKVDTLPDTIGSLENIEELNLSGNKLSVLPNSILKLKKLRSLTLREGNIQELPKGFGSLATLETINMDSTPLMYLPEDFGDLKKLIKFSIQWSKLTALPSRFSEINSLQSLDISFNKITKLPIDIGKMCELGHLRLIGTLVTELPPSLKNLDKLKSLVLSGTPLTAIPDWIGEMKGLSRIRIAKMWHIKKLPNFNGKIISSYEPSFDQPWGRDWLELIGWPGK
jgi:hypothetical protein